MSPKILRFLVALVVLILPSRVSAQLSVPGKVTTYRTIDTDSGEELQRSRSWQIADGRHSAELTATTYPAGTEVVGECDYANGLGQAATSFRSVMRAVSGQLERSDFDTFDPVYYPFLAEPISADMQPGACLNRNSIDVPALIRGDQVKLWLWSDSGLIGAILRAEGDEKLTVPAGTYDALRVGIDIDLSKLFPRVPELFLRLVKPSFTIWIGRAEPYYVLKMKGFGSNHSSEHKNTVTELTATTDLSPTAVPLPSDLAKVDFAGTDPHLRPVNSASFSQGSRQGRVTLADAVTAGGELLVAHVAFNDGLATESRTLIDPHASPVTQYLEDRSIAASGAIARRHVLFFRKAAFPDDPSKDLPSDLYGAETTLGLVLPRMLPATEDQANFHVMDFYGQVNELTITREGTANIALASDDTEAIRAKIKPIVDIPLLLRPLAYFFIPSFDGYFDPGMGHRLLKFEGPLGPPGVPNAVMIADGNPPAAQAVSVPAGPR